MRPTRPVSWLTPARKAFEGFPDGAREILGDELWVVHAFQKKSTHGIKTPKHEIDLIKDRLKRLKEILR
jgi:phage-related protein